MMMFTWLLVRSQEGTPPIRNHREVVSGGGDVSLFVPARELPGHTWRFTTSRMMRAMLSFIALVAMLNLPEDLQVVSDFSGPRAV